MSISLFDLPSQRKAVIKRIRTDSITRERLHSLGLIKGAEISFVKTAPLGCPKIYKCFNTLIAIRGEIAKRVEVDLRNEK